jgi:hypothetical protein
MTKHEANQLLDRCRETSQLSYADTTRALTATGDIEADGGERVDFEIQEEVSRSWDSGRFFMVVADIARYREKTRLTSNQ